MKITVSLNIDALLPMIRDYREAYWTKRADELRGYILDHDLKEKLRNGEISKSEMEAAWNEYHADSAALLNVYSQESMQQLRLLGILRGEMPDEVAELQQAVIDRYGDG